MAETMEQTLENQVRYEEQGPCFYYQPEDEEYDFYWNGVYGDPIQVESSEAYEVVDLIPTGNPQSPELSPAKHLQFFRIIADIYLQQKKGVAVSIEATDEKTGEVQVIAVDINVATGKPLGNLGELLENDLPARNDTEPDLSRFFPETESPR